MPLRTLFDAHLHAEGLSDADLGTLIHFGLEGAVTCAHDALGPATAQNHLAHFEAVVGQVPRLRAAGLAAYAALGIHPARIPWHGLDEVLHALPRFFDGGRVVALGEIGLEKGGEREETVLAQQMELARALRCPVILHNPERDKVRITRRLLSVVKESGVEAHRVLVDHADLSTWRMIRACGHLAGLTVHPGKLTPTDAVRIVTQAGAEGIALTSDIGDGPGDILALPRAAAQLGRSGLSAEVVRRVACQNARTLFQVDEGAVLRRSGT